MMLPPRSYLQGWLVFAAFLRVFSVGVGIFKPLIFQSKVYRRRPEQVTHLQGRTFAAWTLTSCMLCGLCAACMHEPTLYLATMGSFMIAWVKFVAELFIYKTVDVRGAASPFLISSASIIWMATGWGTYAEYS